MDQVKYDIFRLAEHKELVEKAAQWFSAKWGYPESVYLESMKSCVEGLTVPQWYLVMRQTDIIGGLGVIANDFHDRKDLTPNICALYVEEEYRRHGIASNLLQFTCDDFSKKGYERIYMITDYTSLYEKNGWEYVCMVQGQGDDELIRMYVHEL